MEKAYNNEGISRICEAASKRFSQTRLLNETIQTIFNRDRIASSLKVLSSSDLSKEGHVCGRETYSVYGATKVWR